MPKQVAPKSISRPPVIVILGHVDHGKTMLLSKIRQASMPHEPGKITQSIGAYQIERRAAHSGEARRLTFIDTPGHEAFSKMRSRGAKVADLAILVVAADDGVQPQTKEAIATLKETKTPFVVAINKIDKAEIDTSRVKNELTAEGVLLEGYGGSVSYQEVSAKTGSGVEELLDLVLLAADVAELRADPQKRAEGIILESKLESRRGITATVIVKDGTLRAGDPVSAGAVSGKVKAMENALGERIKEAGPSTPALVIGFESLPDIGEPFVAEKIAPAPRPPLGQAVRRRADAEEARGETAQLILKADVSGSLESLIQVIEYLPKPEPVRINIVSSGVGDITDGDVKLAISTGAAVIGFRVKATKAAESLAQTHGIRVLVSEVVYELSKTLEDIFRAREKKIVKGDLEILAVFGKKGANEQIVGGRVTQGAIHNNTALEIRRRESVLGGGRILNLQKEKQDVQALEAGSEGGLLIDAEIPLKVGDHLIER